MPYDSHYVSLESLVLDQLNNPLINIFFILITCLLDIVLTLYGEIISRSLIGVKGLRNKRRINTGQLKKKNKQRNELNNEQTVTQTDRKFHAHFSYLTSSRQRMASSLMRK